MMITVARIHARGSGIACLGRLGTLSGATLRLGSLGLQSRSADSVHSVLNVRYLRTVGEGRLRKETERRAEKARKEEPTRRRGKAHAVATASSARSTGPKPTGNHEHDIKSAMAKSAAYKAAAGGASGRKAEELFKRMEQEVLGPLPSDMSDNSEMSDSDDRKYAKRGRMSVGSDEDLMLSDGGSDMDDFMLDFSKAGAKPSTPPKQQQQLRQTHQQRQQQPSARIDGSAASRGKIVDKVIAAAGLDVADAFEAEARRLKKNHNSAKKFEEVNFQTATQRHFIRDSDAESDLENAVVDIVEESKAGGRRRRSALTSKQQQQQLSQQHKQHENDEQHSGISSDSDAEDLEEPAVFDFGSASDGPTVVKVGSDGSVGFDAVQRIFGLPLGDPLGELMRRQLQIVHPAALQPRKGGDAGSGLVKLPAASAGALEAGRKVAAALLASLPRNDYDEDGAEQSSSVTLEKLDPLRGAVLDPENFPAASRFFKEADLSKLPQYPARRTAAAIKTLRERSEVHALQRVTLEVCRLLPRETQQALLSHLSTIDPILLSDGAHASLTPALEHGGTQLAPVKQERHSTLTRSRPAPVPYEVNDDLVDPVGMLADAAGVSKDKIQRSMLSMPDGFSSKGGGLVVGDDVDVSKLTPKDVAGREESDGERKSMFDRSDKEEDDEIRALRAELGYDKPLGMRSPPKREGGSRKQQAALLQRQHEEHAAELHRLKGDPEALAQYVMAEADKPDAGLEASLAAVGDVDELADVPQKVSLVPAGFKDWGEVAAKHSSNPKRAKKAAALLEAERNAVLKKAIKPAADPAGKEPSRRQVRVAANIHRVIESVFSKRVVRDPSLYPGDMSIEIVDVSVTPDLRTAYVRWMLPFPVLSVANTHAADALYAGSAVGRSGSSAALISSIMQRNATQRGTGSREASPTHRRTVGQHTKDYYGDESDLSHLTPSMRKLVQEVSAAVDRNQAQIKRSVGFSLGMQFMPRLEFHRLVAAETDGMLDATLKKISKTMM